MSALIARIEARIVEAERALGRMEMLLARGHHGSLAPEFLAQRRADLADDLARLNAHRTALYQEQAATERFPEREPGAAPTSEGAA